MRKKYFSFFFILIFSLLNLLNTSHLLAETNPKILCKDSLQTHQSPTKKTPQKRTQEQIEQQIREYVEQQIEELGGNEYNFSKKYKSVHGFLDLAHELSEITEDINLIFEVVFSILQGSHFSLEWFRFDGTLSELEKLVNGAFSSRYSIRKEDGKFVFRLENGESFPISGGEGFDRFVERVFSGDEEKALNAAATIFRLRELSSYVLNWIGAESLKAGVKTPEHELLDTLNEPTPFKRRIDEIRRKHTLQEFFKETQGLDVSSRSTRVTTFGIRSDQLTPEQQKEFTVKSIIDEGTVVVGFDITLSSDSSLSTGPFIITHISATLNLQEVEKFLKKLDLVRAKLVFRHYLQKTFMGAILFNKADAASIEEANRKGLFLIQVPENRWDESDLKFTQLKQLNSEGFQPANLTSPKM